MMARKLSVVGGGVNIPVITASFATLALCAFAQSAPPDTALGGAIANPFATAGARQRVATAEPSDALRGPTTFQNPFAAAAKAPPIDNLIRTGPLSRWRRPTNLHNDSTDTKSALRTPGNLEKGLSESASSTAQNALLENLGTDQIIRSTPNSVTQPSSIDDGTSTTLGPVIAGPCNTAGDTTFPDPATYITDQVTAPPTIEFGPKSNIQDAQRADMAAVLGNCDDTPAAWLAQAQDAASNAASVEQLATVIALCDHGLQHSPPTDLLASLRRLSAWAHNRRGEILADTQHPDEAVQDFQVAISMDPKCSLAIHNRAVTLAQRNQYAAALRDFNRVIELNPGLAVAYRNRAELLVLLNRMDEAIGDYSQAIAAMPDDSALLCARAHTYQRISNFAAAAADLNRAILIAPNDPGILTQRGNLAAEQGRYEKARDDFEQALTIEADWTEALRSLAWLQATCPDQRYRNAAQALATAQRAAKLAPENDYQILDTLAAANAGVSRFDQAVQLQQKALAAAPRDLSTPLEERLALYQRGKSYVANSPRSDVRRVSHEEAQAKPASRPSPPSTQRR